MANNCKLKSTVAVGALQHICDAVDAGAGAGKLVIYVGTEAAYADDAAGGSAAATCTLSDPSFASAAADGVNHRANADLDVTPVPTDASAAGGNPVTHFRLLDSTDAVVLQGTVGTASCDLNLNSTNIGAGAQVQITSLQLRLPYNQA